MISFMVHLTTPFIESRLSMKKPILLVPKSLIFMKNKNNKKC